MELSQQVRFLWILKAFHKIYIPDGRNAGYIEYIHGGVARNVVEDIANLGLNSTFVGIVDNTALGKDVKQHLQN